MLTGICSRKGFEAPLRRIKFNDPETGKRLVFPTNNFALPALMIAQLQPSALASGGGRMPLVMLR